MKIFFRFTKVSKKSEIYIYTVFSIDNNHKCFIRSSK